MCTYLSVCVAVVVVPSIPMVTDVVRGRFDVKGCHVGGGGGQDPRCPKVLLMASGAGPEPAIVGSVLSVSLHTSCVSCSRPSASRLLVS